MNERRIYGTKKLYPKLFQRSVREKNIVKYLINVAIYYAGKTLLLSSDAQSGVSIVKFVTFIGIPVAIESASSS